MQLDRTRGHCRRFNASILIPGIITKLPFNYCIVIFLSKFSALCTPFIQYEIASPSCLWMKKVIIDRRIKICYYMSSCMIDLRTALTAKYEENIVDLRFRNCLNLFFYSQPITTECSKYSSL